MEGHRIHVTVLAGWEPAPKEILNGPRLCSEIVSHLVPMYGRGFLRRGDVNLRRDAMVAPGNYTYAVPGAQQQLLTAAEWLRQPVPRLNNCLSEGVPMSQICAQHPRTFEVLHPWTDFEAGVGQMLAHLAEEHPDPCYNRPVWDPIPGPVDSYHVTVAAEVDVRGALMFQTLRYINQIASTLGLEFEYQGNGSGRAMSYTDIVLRRCGVSDRNDQSRLILGVLEVKGAWQWDLPADTDLVSAQHDPEQLKVFLPVLQQAYGDAVTDEAPLLILSTYDVTYFILRHTDDPTQRHLLVSKPVPFSGSQAVPFLAAWMHALFVAQKLWDGNVKGKLCRAAVPAAPVGSYRDQSDGSFEHPVLSLDAKEASGFQLLESCQQAIRPDKGPREMPDAATDGTIAIGSGSSVPTSSGSNSSDDSIHLGSVPELSFDILGFTSKCLASSRNTRVVEGAWLHEGVRHAAALKVFNNYDPDTLQDFQREVDAYQRLLPLQGTTIAKVLTVGRLPHTGARVLVLQYGQPVPHTSDCKDKAEATLQTLHAAGVSHGDIHPRNLLLYGDTVVLCDLETCKFDPTSADFQADEYALDTCWAA